MTITRIAVSDELPIPIEKVMSRLDIEIEDLDPQAQENTTDAVTASFLAAIDYVEKQTHLVLRPTTFRLDSRSWCLVSGCSSRRCGCCQPLLLQRAPFREVEQIEYLGSGEITYDVMPADEYSAQPLSDGGLIHLNDGLSLPSIESRWNAVRITFTAGFAIPGESGTEPHLELPPALQQALIMLTGHWFTNRDAVGTERAYEVPIGAASLMTAFQHYR